MRNNRYYLLFLFISHQVRFDLNVFPRLSFINNLTLFNKGEQAGKLTSIVWSPRYKKHLGFLIADKSIEQNSKNYLINKEVPLDIIEIN